MAKQGNYITAPTSNANWAAGIADSLSGLSDRYMDQAAAKKDSELAAEALAYNRGRDVLTDSRYDTEQQRITKQRDALANGIKNYSAADARAAALARDPELAAYVDTRRKASELRFDQNTIYDATSDQVGPLSKFDLLKRSEGGTHMIMKDMPTGTELALALEQGIDAGYINEQDYLDGKKAISKTFDDYVSSNMNLYRAKENSNILQSLVAAGADPAKAAAVAENLSKQFSSKKELTAAAVASQKAAYVKSKYNADTAFKIYKEQNKDSKSSGVTKGNVDISDLSAHLDLLDPGWMDKGTLSNFWQYAVDNGVNSKIAMHAIDKSVFIDRWGKGINRTKEDFLQFAKGLEAANKSGGNKDKYDEFIAKEATFVDPMLQNKRAFMGGVEDLLVAPKTPNKYATKLSLPEPSANGDKDLLSKELLSSSISEKQGILKKLQQELFDANSAGDSTRVSNISSRMDLVQNNLGQAEMYQNDQEMLAKIKSKDSGSMFYDVSTLRIMPFNEKGIKEPWGNTVKLINNNPAINGNNRVDEKLYELSKDDPVLQQRIMDRSNQAIHKYLTDKVSTKISVLGSQGGADAKVAAKMSDLAHYFNLTTFDPTADSYKNKVPKQQKLELLNEISSYLEDNMGAVNSDIVRPTGVVKSKAVVTPLPAVTDTPEPTESGKKAFIEQNFNKLQGIPRTNTSVGVTGSFPRPVVNTSTGSTGSFPIPTPVRTGPTTRPVMNRVPVPRQTGPTTRPVVSPVPSSKVLPDPLVANSASYQAFSQKEINNLQNKLLPKNSNYSLADVVDNLDVFLQKNPKPEFVSMLQNLVRYNRQSMDPLLVKAIAKLTT
jgi:hypothetical protein